MKKIVSLMMVLLLAGSFVFAAGQAETDDVNRLNFAAAGVAGTYYPLAVGMSRIITDIYPDIQITVETTGGGVENARLVGSGLNDLGLANNNFSLFAYEGKAPYQESHTFYSVAYLYPAALHMIVRENSSIYTISDLKGKRVAVGPAGGGTIEVLRDVLPYYGLEESDIKMSYISFTDGANALRDGNVDANMVIAGPPAAAAKELAETADIRFISVDEDIIDQMNKDFGYYVPAIFPKSMFKTEEEVVTVGGGVQWIVRDGISEDVVYRMTKAIFDNLDKVREIHPITSYFDLESAPYVSIPMHPGAVKYFEEKGISVNK